MSMMLMVRAMQIKVGNPLRKLVLLKLADNSSDQGECWPSIQYIADQCEISKRSVINHIDELCNAGMLKKVSRKGPKGNSTNVYVLTLPSAGDAPGVVQEMHVGSAGDAPPPSAGDAPGISHSFEPVKEPLDSKKKSSSLPEGFSPAPSHHKMAEEYGISLQEEFDKFIDHHLSKGSKFIDWNRALNTWLRNARGFQKSRPSNQYSKSPSSAITVSKTGLVFWDR